MSSELDDVKRQVAIANRVLTEVGLAVGVTAALGHVSMRIPSEPDKFVVKGRGYSMDVLATMQPQDMVVCDMEGFKLDGPPGSYQCHEVKIHSCILKTRPDVQSVVHVHPRFTVLMSVLQKTLVPVCTEGMQLVRYPLPVYPRVKIITSEEGGMEVANLLGNNKAVIFLGHGAATAGSSISDAVQTMLLLEEQAKMNWYAYCAAGPDHPRIPDELIDETIDAPATAVKTLPHFRDQLRDLPSDWNPRGGYGTYDYYAQLVSKDL